jgi:polar amino acid transport system substrate-binding protein
MSNDNRRVGVRSAAASALAIALAMTGCSGGSEQPELDLPFSTVEAGVLKVAPYGSSPPIIIQESGELSGYLGALINGFAEEHGLEVELFETDFSAALAATQQGRADFTPFIYHNDERATTVYYTSATFVLPGAVIAPDTFDYQGPQSLEGARVGAVVGQVWSPYLTEALGDGAILYQSAAEAGTALVNGQIDVYVNSAAQMYNQPLVDQDNLTAHYLEVGDFDMPEIVINNYGTNVVSCENPELARAFDEYVQQQFDSGELEALQDELDFPEEFRLDEFPVPAQGCGE